MLPRQGLPFWSLVRELRSHMPWGVDKKKGRGSFGNQLDIVGSYTCKYERFYAFCIFWGFPLSLCTKVLFQSSHLSLKESNTALPSWVPQWELVRILKEVMLRGQSQGLLVSFLPPEIFVCSVTCHSVFCFNEENYPFIVPQTLLLEAPSQLGCWVKGQISRPNPSLPKSESLGQELETSAFVCILKVENFLFFI